MRYIRPTRAEIDLGNLAFNVRQIRKSVGPYVKIMGVIKANAYGTGARGIVDTLIENGIDMLGVGILDEALNIRRWGQKIPLLVFGYTPFDHSKLLVMNNITQTVYCMEQAKKISQEAVRLGREARIHIELDTGMGRLGFLPSSSSLEKIKAISTLPKLKIEGIYTHCPYTNERKGSGKLFTENQFKVFCEMTGLLEKGGLYIPLKHACNSLGTVHYPYMHMNMVRAGIILYGSYPSFQDLLPLKPVMSLKTRIGFIKKIKQGKNISYGRNFVTKRETAVATLPLGYGDGYNRMLSNSGEVLVRGQRAPIIGSICMDQCMVDITDIKGNCKIGEEVVVIGKQGNEEITFEEISRKICGFINYEYMVLITSRVPRVYKKRVKQ